MAEDAVFNIVIGVQNRERIKQLESDISDAEKEIKNLSAAINQAGSATDQQANQLRMYGKDIQAHRGEIIELTKANRSLGESAEQGGVNARTLTRAMYQLDEGARGLMYSLPTLAVQMGASGELAAGIGFVAVALVELSKSWGDLQDDFKKTHGIDSAKTALEMLADYLKTWPSGTVSSIGGKLGGISEELASARKKLGLPKKKLLRKLRAKH